MPTSAGLKKILKENQIRGYSDYTKSKFIDLLVKRGLIPEKYDTNKQVKVIKDIYLKYNFLKQMHSNPKKVEIHDKKKQIRLFFILLYTRLLWPWNKILV